MVSRRNKSDDKRELPAYVISEAAQYLQIPRATLRSWVVGRHYPTESGNKFFNPLISLPVKDNLCLSFVNLVEAHVLNAIRRQHKVSIPKVRAALNYLERRFKSKHPLAKENFETDGYDLFIQKYGALINISQDGQLALREMLAVYLQRIERDKSGIPIKLYPFTGYHQSGQPKAVVVDPQISFGRPILVGTGILTDVIADRYKAGESIEALTDDYARSPDEIQEAIRFELNRQAA